MAERQISKAFAEQAAAAAAGDVCAGPTDTSDVYRLARASGILIAPNLQLRQLPLEQLVGETPLEPDENWWERVDTTKVDCSHNEIAVCPPVIGLLTKLLTLKLAHNRLADLPDQLCCLPLVHLDISHNQLQHLPEDFSALSSLLELNLAHNQLTALPGSGLPSSLVQLRLSHNRLSALPASLDNLHKLSLLSASNNQLDSVAAGALPSVHLQQLDLAFNLLPTLPSLEGLSLHTIDLSHNKLTALPRMPATLVSIAASDNQLDQLQLPRCPELLELSLGGNSLSILPEELCVHTTLRTLDVSQNQLLDLPISLGYLPSLNRLSIDGNPVCCSLPQTNSTETLKKVLRERGAPPAELSTSLTSEYWKDNPSGSHAEWHAQRRHRLSMSGEMSELDIKLQTCSQIGRLDLGEMQLDSVPVSAMELGLVAGSAWQTDVVAVRDDVAADDAVAVHAVLWINFSNNVVVELPADFAECFCALQHLDLSSNR